MAVSIDIQIAQQSASVELPESPEQELSTAGDKQMAQELGSSPDMAMQTRGRIMLQNATDGVTYYGGIDNFSSVQVGAERVAAEGATDTLELIAGDGIELDADGKAITIASTGGGGGGTYSPRLGYDTVGDVTYLSVLED
jgi:hypothetical protein